jgi:ABC-2 type transport system ATP-binding protein
MNETTQRDVIRVENLTKEYPGIRALDNVCFSVPEKQLFAYLGPNGSGKTTTIGILTGLIHPTSGSAWLAGYDVFREKRQAKRRCGLVSQTINLDRDLTVYENLMLHGRLYDMSGKKLRDRIDYFLEYIELTGEKDVFVKRLSGGMQRRVMIIRALIHNPEILFLDEPTVGLDPAIRRQIWGLIKRIRQEGATIFLTTHYIEEVEFLADRVAFLCKGQIVATGTPKELMSDIGEWAMDFYTNGKMETRYFRTREEAVCAAQNPGGEFNLRRVNLEDAFLKMTGKRVAP